MASSAAPQASARPCVAQTINVANSAPTADDTKPKNDDVNPAIGPCGSSVIAAELAATIRKPIANRNTKNDNR